MGANQPARVVLPARLTIDQAGALCAELRQLAVDHDDFVVDGSAVSEVDTAALQVLLSLWMRRRPGGFRCAWQGASEPLRRSARLIGLGGPLCLDG